MGIPPQEACTHSSSQAHLKCTHLKQRALGELRICRLGIKAVYFRIRNWFTVSQKTSREQRLELPGLTLAHTSDSPTCSPLSSRTSSISSSSQYRAELCLRQTKTTQVSCFSPGWLWFILGYPKPQPPPRGRLSKLLCARRKPESDQHFTSSQARQQTCPR